METSVRRIALIGERGHFRLALEGLDDLPHVRIVGLSDGASDDPVARAAAWCRQRGHEPPIFSDYRKMLDTTKPDAVVVCGPFELHAQMSIDAIERDMHVFVEKPAALTMDDFERLRAAHARHPKVHLAGMMASRYDPGFHTAWKLISQGAIGDVRLLNARKSYKLGKRPAYYHDRSTYGGTIPWVGSHAIDWVLWMCRHQVEAIYAVHSAACNEGHGSMERAAMCHFSLSGGRAASVSIDVFRPPTAPTHGDDWIRVVGTAGVIEARPNALSITNHDHDGSETVPISTDRQIFRDFVDHIEGTRRALIDAQQTLVLTEVCLLARQAADERAMLHVGHDRSLKYPEAGPLHG